MIKVLKLTKSNWDSFSPQLQSLENFAEYPYGDDHFKLNHGKSYFSFFERLGIPIFHVAIDGTQVIACASGVLREVPYLGNKVKTWYLCDLKVHPDYRRQGIPSMLFRKNLFKNYFQCSRAYAVSMNPITNTNPVVKLTKKLPFFPIKYAKLLNIYSFNYDEIKKITHSLQDLLGPITFLSLAGKKDLLMKSTGDRLPILHIQHGSLAEDGFKEPQKNYTHMICSPKSTILDQLLSTHAQPAATASVLSYRMNKTDWSFILTSDI